MIHVYLDAEFDAVKIDHKYVQAVISLGAVVCDENLQEVDSFYAMVRPKYFKRLTPVVKRMTRLKDIDVLNGNPLAQVITDFLSWIHQYEKDIVNIQLYSFGPDDRRTLCKNCRIHNISCSLLDGIQDLQKVLSREVLLDGVMLSSTLSLDDVKTIYRVTGTVDHNALNDARDLMKCHQHLQKQELDQEAIEKIALRKKQKEEESKCRQQEKLQKWMREHFDAYTNMVQQITLYPEVVDQFRMWEDRDVTFKMHWKKHEMLFMKRTYPYDTLQIWMEILVKDIHSYVILYILENGERTAYTYHLNYRNSTMVENILKQQGRNV